MIAYVFWHTPAAGIRVPDYERGLASFHDSLAVSRPEGFRSSMSRRCRGLPWLVGDPVYEDWYLVDDFAALGVLNEQAAAGRHGPAHDHVAAFSDRGTGSIYSLEIGTVDPEAEFVWWFDRPEGVSTALFLEEVRFVVRRHEAVLWRRQLSLGPAMEYCISSGAGLELPFETAAMTAERRVWPLNSASGKPGTAAS